MKEKLEEKKRKPEGRIRYYERRAEKHGESRKIVEVCAIRGKAAQEELEQINRQLDEENGAYGDCYGVFHVGNTYQVAEQKYYCVKLKVAGGEGILEVRKKFRHQCWQTAFTWKSAGRVRKRKTN